MSKVNYRSQFSYGFAGQPVVLRAKISIGASGAPTIASGTGMGISSIVHDSAGQYTITLDDKFRDLLDVRMAMYAGTSAPAAPIMSIEVDSVSTGVLTLQMRDLSGAVADPASGEVLHLSIELNRSSTGY